VKEVKIQPKHVFASMFSFYLGRQETSILIELVNSVSPKVMIEFGCNRGVTAKRVLENVPSLEKYIGIDVPPDYQPKLACQHSEVPKRAGTFASGDDRFYLLSVPSIDLKPENLEPCDAVFIDGDHSFGAVMHDSLLARALLRSGGIIVWHDFNNPGVEVTKALTQLSDDGWAIESVEGSWLAYLRS
jgi:predicted O-methyltransferase YrrM